MATKKSGSMKTTVPRFGGGPVKPVVNKLPPTGQRSQTVTFNKRKT